MGSRRVSPAALLIAAPAYAVGAALLVVAVLQFAAATQPGETMEDLRPTDNVTTGMGVLLAGTTLLFLGYFAAKRPALASSLIITTGFAVGLALFMLLAASRSHSATYLLLAAAFAYPAVVALARLVALRRALREKHS